MESTFKEALIEALKKKEGVATKSKGKKMKKSSRCWTGYKPTPGKKPYSDGSCMKAEAKTPAWQRSAGQNKEGGLNAKGRASAKAQGHDLKPPVSAKAAKKSKKKASRRASFCARMGGMKKRLTSKKTASDPDSRINKALRKWDC